MRLIDADQMAVDESEAYMSEQGQITDDLKWLVNFAAHSKIQRIIADTPTVDAVPVVRCKNCRKRHTWECAMHYESEDGKEQYGWENDNDFCSWGERMGGDE